MLDNGRSFRTIVLKSQNIILGFRLFLLGCWCGWFAFSGFRGRRSGLFRVYILRFLPDALE
jgi:hypothetical protein